jgi:hypothetical protein
MRGAKRGFQAAAGADLIRLRDWLLRSGIFPWRHLAMGSMTAPVSGHFYRDRAVLCLPIHETQLCIFV